MKIRHNCLLYLPTIILLFTLWDSSKRFAAAAASGGNNDGTNNHNNNNNRRKKTIITKTTTTTSEPSILEIMNTQEIEKLIAQRRLNNSLARSGNQRNPLIIQNDLDEDFEFSEKLSQQASAAALATAESTQQQQHHFVNKSDRYKSQHQYNRRQQQQQQQQNRDKISTDNDYGGYDNIGNIMSSHSQLLQNQSNQRRRYRDDQQKLTASLPASMELLSMPYNDSYYSDLLSKTTTDNNFPSSNLVDSRDHMMRGDKLLKSSKNALYITRKEYLKKDWCKTEPLVQRIREPGCLTRTFVNRFCYGQCNSFYIPKSPKKKRNHSLHHHNSGGRGNVGGGGNSGMIVGINRYLSDDHFDDEDLTGAAFQSCSFCKPKKFTWITVTLRCPSLVPQLRKKRVQRIKQCRCMAEPVE